MSWTHFDENAEDYHSARPPYPAALFDLLRAERVIGPGLDVLEVGAGTGQATRELVALGSRVVAIEPGRDLAELLAGAVPGASVIQSRFEDAELPAAAFDAAVAATSLHWVDLAVGLPLLHSALRPDGVLAVFRNVFGDDDFDTEFRDHVARIVALREDPSGGGRSDGRPTVTELTAAGHFVPVRSEQWRWSIELTTAQVTRLFRTFSNWTEPEVARIEAAAEACGGRVTEHYRTVLHLLRRT